jgi:F-type H+-transporting ATPase subunit alpha
MADVNPAEVSAILKEQLSGFEAKASLDEVGTVLTVGDGIANVYGLENAEYGELVEFESGLQGMVLNLAEDNVGVVLLGKTYSKNCFYQCRRRNCRTCCRYFR